MSVATVETTWEAHGLECAVLLIRNSHRCGYVRVPEDHPWFGLHYSDEVPNPAPPPEDATVEDYGMAGLIGALAGEYDFLSHVEGQVRVHGGVTFAGDRPPTTGLTEGWWFGFDCAHAGDRSSFHPDGIPWETEEVVTETERMAEQIAAAHPDSNKEAADGQ